MEKKKVIKNKKAMTLDGLAILIKNESSKTDKFFTLVQGEFLGIQKQFKELGKEINERFSEVDQRFDAMDKRFDALEATNRSEHEEIRVRLRAIENELNAKPSDDDFYELDKRLTSVEFRLKKVEA
ncbi:hypothetical protein HY061_02890 [Candidatus Azambacteria bacterium]|nr:hypothetical protein [Candidatus Azambacteria bacterium]